MEHLALESMDGMGGLRLRNRYDLALAFDGRIDEAILDPVIQKKSLWPFLIGARDRNRTGTPAINEAADFKSAVSIFR
jgi:hypothetical protein